MELSGHCWWISYTPQLLLPCSLQEPSKCYCEWYIVALLSQTPVSMGGCVTAGFVPEDQCWSILELAVTSVLKKYMWVTRLFWIFHAPFQLLVNVCFICRAGSTDNFLMKLLFPFIIALLALVLLLLVLPHSFSWSFGASVCYSDILRLQLYKVKEPIQLLIDAEKGSSTCSSGVHQAWCLLDSSKSWVYSVSQQK